MRFNEYGADKSAVGAMNRPLRRCWSILEKCIIGIHGAGVFWKSALSASATTSIKGR